MFTIYLWVNQDEYNNLYNVNKMNVYSA